MSFPFKATVTRASNGTIELTPDNQHDLPKLAVGAVVSLDAAPEGESKVAVAKAKAPTKVTKQKKKAKK